jgi:hypothetical protein
MIDADSSLDEPELPEGQIVVLVVPTRESPEEPSVCTAFPVDTWGRLMPIPSENRTGPCHWDEAEHGARVGDHRVLFPFQVLARVS